MQDWCAEETSLRKHKISQKILTGSVLHQLCVTVTWPTSTSCIATLPFPNQVPWLQRIVECPRNTYSRILVVIGHPGLFFSKYSELGHTTLLAYYVYNMTYSDASKALLDLAAGFRFKCCNVFIVMTRDQSVILTAKWTGTSSLGHQTLSTWRHKQV